MTRASIANARIRPALALTIARVSAAGATAAEPQLGANFALRGGAVYTMNDAHPWARAVAIKNGRLASVGNDDGATSHIGPHTRVIDLENRMVLPGFTIRTSIPSRQLSGCCAATFTT